jgi:hypothetical protein
VTDAGRVQRRCARYGAGLLLLAGSAVVLLVGALQGIPLERLWLPLVWGGLACLALGWAIGHAAGRLYGEVKDKRHDESDRSEEEGEPRPPGA